MKRAALAVHLLSALAIALAYASAFLPGGAPGWAAPLLAVGTGAALVSVMALGAARGGRIGWLWVPFALTLVLVSGGLLLLLALPPADPAEPALVLGLPLRAAVLLYGVGLLPAFVVPVAYALTFDRLTLGEEELERVRAVGRRRRGGAAAGEATDGNETPGAGGDPRDRGAPRDRIPPP